MSNNISATSTRATDRGVEAQKAVSAVVDGIDDAGVFFKLAKKAEEAAQSAT